MRRDWPYSPIFDPSPEPPPAWTILELMRDPTDGEWPRYWKARAERARLRGWRALATVTSYVKTPGHAMYSSLVLRLQPPGGRLRCYVAWEAPQGETLKLSSMFMRVDSGTVSGSPLVRLTSSAITGAINSDDPEAHLLAFVAETRAKGAKK